MKAAEGSIMLSGRWTTTAGSDVPVCHSNFMLSLAKVAFPLPSVCLWGMDRWPAQSSQNKCYFELQGEKTFPKTTHTLLIILKTVSGERRV